MDTNIVPIQPAAPQDGEDDFQSKMLDYTSARIYLNRLVDDWKDECIRSDKRRQERKLDIDIELLREKNDLDEDETIVPIRIIDSNISREQPSYINYLKNSRRVAIFEPLDDPNFDTDLIEQEFTKKATYTAWEIPFFKCLDGSQIHGYDAIEVVYDEDKPGNFSLEQIGHDKLFFPRSSLDIQQSPRVIRAYDVTLTQLEPWVEQFGFNRDQVDLISQSRKNNTKESETIRIYKCFYKIKCVVYCAWFCLTNGCTDWIKAPQPHYIGIDEKVQNAFNPLEQNSQPQENWQPKQLDIYPIFILPYKLNEEARIVDCKGRGFLDSYKQEAMTALWSSFINGMNRASSLYASPTAEDGTGSSLKELENLKIVPGRFMSKPITFWSPPYPDAMVLRTLQFSDVQNSEENNQVNFSAMNREDSRKTAKEIGAAQQQQTKLDSVQLTLFSTFVRQIFSLVWKIVQSQALQNKIQFLLIEQQIPIPHPIDSRIQMSNPDGQPMTKTIMVNDVESISKRFNIRSAGDVDVIQKEEIINKMRQDWPVISVTALKDAFLIDYIRLAYPDKQRQYTQILQQAGQVQQMKSLIGQLSTTLEGVLKDSPQLVQTLPPNQQSQISNMMMESKQVIGQPITE